MKDSEFIELLNLYVDHEITSVDAARLEAEVARNSKRAGIYREYCSMQKACMILAEQFRETAPVPGTERIAATGTRSGAWRLSFAAVGLASAACLGALLFARHSFEGPRAAAPASLAAADVHEARAVASAARAEPANPPLFNLRLEPEIGSGAALVASGDQQDPFAWMNQLQLAPIQRAAVSPLMFDQKGAPVGPPVNAQKTLRGPVEMTAFQLQLDK